MKKHIKLFNFFFLFLPLLSLAGNGDEIQKKKTINKSYPVTANDKLEIENTFGNILVQTWDKSEITVDIEIVANAPTEEKAQDIMDEISVKDIHSGNIIAFKTKVGDIHNNGNKNHHDMENDRAFYIDYVIHMPAGNRLELTNSFGKMTVPDLTGEVNLTSKFGSLTAGKLKNVDIVQVEFGKANIAEVSNGKVVFKFNQESRIGNVNGTAKITSEFSQNVQFNVSDDIQDLAVFESYSKVRMVVSKSLSGDFDVHSSFGNFHNDTEFGIHEEREKGENDYGPHFDKDYRGKAGDGKAKIKIKDSFGSIRLTHSSASSNEEDDDKSPRMKNRNDNKQKDKNKNKDKDKHEDDDDDRTT